MFLFCYTAFIAYVYVLLQSRTIKNS